MLSERVTTEAASISPGVVAVGPGPFQRNVVTVSGSMRYFDQMLTVADELSRQLYIVLMPFVRHESGQFAYTPHQGAMPVAKVALDELHLDKLRLSTLLAVVSDETGYYGESTRAEIEYARSFRILVMFARVTQEGIIWDRNPIPTPT